MTDPRAIAAVARQGALVAGSSTATVAWWSFTKTLMAAAALKLHEEGRLELDTCVDQYSFTLRQLLRHTAGLGNYGGLKQYHDAVKRGECPWSDDELFARIPPSRPLFRPGAGWAYSNVGYLIVRRCLERVLDEDLGAVLNGIVLVPLGVEDARLAKTPRDLDETAFPPPFTYDPGWAFHGCIIGPASNAALALHRLIEGRFFSPSTRAAFLDRHGHGGPIHGRPWASIGYGTGVMMPTLVCGGESVCLVGHSAAGPGSVGAVYGTLEDRPLKTVSVFSAGDNESAVESCAAARLSAEYGLQS